MTTAADGQLLMAASQAVVRSMLDGLLGKNHKGGVLGIHARAEWDGPESFTHDNRSVRVAACPSTLTVWEALSTRGEENWLVILTPRDKDDLGGGVMSHLIGNRLRTPDPWEAVRQRFSAERLDPQLYRTGERSRAIAAGLLGAIPYAGCMPAPAGVLTRDHAMTTIAQSRLDLVEAGSEIDVTAVMAWSALPNATALLADLRKSAGDALTDELIDWLAERCGLAADPVRTLLRSGRVVDVVPLGVIAGLLNSADVATAHAVGSIQGRFGLARLTPPTLEAWHADAAWLITHALAEDRGSDLALKILNLATKHVNDLGLDGLARGSDLLPTGLQARLDELAAELRKVLPEPPIVTAVGGDRVSADLDQPIVTACLDAVEAMLARTRDHHLAAMDDTVGAFEAAVRLVRWLARDVSVDDAGAPLATLVRRHIVDDSWVDTAVNVAARGSADSALGEVLGEVLELVRARRDEHDRAFAAALTATAGSDHLGVEDLLPEVVVPLAKQQPVLLLVLDGLTAGVANQLVHDAGQAGWTEYPIPGNVGRAAALAVLPTLTEYSRCSLLSGDLRHGHDDAERAGFEELLKAAGLEHRLSGGGGPPLFHKKQLDTSKAGLSLDQQVHSAIADTENLRLVGAVLNAVDDALHHTDPGGIDWTLGNVRHLKPLLEAARRAGRTVAIVSDHGHVIERRAGVLRQHNSVHGARSRADTPNDPVSEDEIVVRGPRVLTADRAAILAVNERLRYGPLNAGYHGGASPAEVVTPVVVLHPGDDPAVAGLSSIDGATPPWWQPTRLAVGRKPVVHEASHPTPKPSVEPPQHSDPPTLFDVAPSRPTETTVPVSDALSEPTADAHATQVARAVVGSKIFEQQQRIAGRIPMDRGSIAALLAALLSAPGNRMSAEESAATLGVSVSRLRGALHLLKRVLDVEGYVVISYESGSGDVVLDETTLREQFGVTG